MANKKSGSKSVTLSKSFFAFWGIALAAFAVLLGFILNAISSDLGVVAKVFNAIGAVAIAIALIPSAWAHVANKNIAWKIIFFIAVAIYIVFVVLAAF